MTLEQKSYKHKIVDPRAELTPEQIALREEIHRVIEGRVKRRDFKLYLAYFDLKPEDLVGKRVLDIGAGAALFAKHARQEGLDVTPVDPLYAIPEGREIFKNVTGKNFIQKLIEKWKKIETTNPQALAALGDNLPLKNGSFDAITTVYSSLYYPDSDEKILVNFDEHLRVLEKGGKLFVFPFRDFDRAGIFPMQFNGEDSYRMNLFFADVLAEREKKGDIQVRYGRPRNIWYKDMLAGSDYKQKRYACITKC